MTNKPLQSAHINEQTNKNEPCILHYTLALWLYKRNEKETPEY